MNVLNQTVAAGHTILIQYNGSTIGKAQGLDGDRDFGTENVYEIGTMMPVESVNNKYQGTLTLDRFFVRNNDLVAVGIASLGEEVLTKGLLTIVVLDKYTGKTLRTYRRCTISNYRETFRANSIAGENATFFYLSSDKGTPYRPTAAYKGSPSAK